MLFWVGAGHSYGQPCDLEMNIMGECPGTLKIEVANAVPNGEVGIVYSLGYGETPLPTCPGVFLDISHAHL